MSPLCVPSGLTLTKLPSNTVQEDVGSSGIPSGQVLAVEPFLLQHTSIKGEFGYISQSGIKAISSPRPWDGSSMAALAALSALPKPSAKLCTERERLAAAGASLNPSEALRGGHRGNDFLFSSIRKEYVPETGSEGSESNRCKLWDEETELSSCPLTSFTWSHSSGLQASRASPK